MSTPLLLGYYGDDGHLTYAGRVGTGIVHRLQQAQLHVLQATEHVERQRKLIAVLEADGPARLIPEAEKLLRYFENELALHVEDRDRLTNELSQIGKDVNGKKLG